MIHLPLDSKAAAMPTRSVTDLLQDTASHTENVVRGEIRLAVVRAQEQITSKIKQIALFAIGGVLGVFALVLLLVASVLLLYSWFEAWKAAAIVGVVVALAAAGVAYLATKPMGDN
jgi:uncharacterized membrane protein YqjE